MWEQYNMETSTIFKVAMLSWRDSKLSLIYHLSQSIIIYAFTISLPSIHRTVHCLLDNIFLTVFTFFYVSDRPILCAPQLDKPYKVCLWCNFLFEDKSGNSFSLVSTFPFTILLEVNLIPTIPIISYIPHLPTLHFHCSNVQWLLPVYLHPFSFAVQILMSI